ncbi:MAG: transglycosylase domain-containing protein, partial [Gammaproteobacteria bacterium]|nr:transglycosylase domain-containing protein [Gammaproteobacteria bacterium]
MITSILLRAMALAASLALAFAVGLAVVVVTIMPQLPSIESLDDIKLKVPMRIYTADSLLIAEFGEERRIPVRREEVPEQLINAILTAEDDAFFSHSGVDLM